MVKLISHRALQYIVYTYNMFVYQKNLYKHFIWHLLLKEQTKNHMNNVGLYLDLNDFLAFG